MGRRKLPFVLGSEWLQGGGEVSVARGLEGGEGAVGGREGWGHSGAREVGALSCLSPTPPFLARRTLHTAGKPRRVL